MKKLGFGLMRLPLNTPGNAADIDLAATQAMMDRFLQAGFTYFDTSYVYHGGASEAAFRETVVKRYPRGAFTITDKMPMFQIEREDQLWPIFSETLQHLGVDYLDYYWLHSLDKRTYRLSEELHAFRFVQQRLAEGSVRHIGFSFHDTADVLEEILKAHPEMEYVQLQLNYLDWSFQDAKAKVELLKEYHLPVWVMEPLRGGRLASLTPEETAKLQAMRPDEKVPAWAFRFLQSIPEVTMMLSGMSNMGQMQENIRTFEEDKPLSETEMKNLLAMAEEMVKKIVLPCTACHYCVSHCPQGLDIPRLLELYNEHCFTQGGFIAPMALAAIPQDKQPTSCIGCRSCEAVCPQQIHISEAMADFAAKLGA